MKKPSYCPAKHSEIKWFEINKHFSQCTNVQDFREKIKSQGMSLVASNVDMF